MRKLLNKDLTNTPLETDIWSIVKWFFLLLKAKSCASKMNSASLIQLFWSHLLYPWSLAPFTSAASDSSWVFLFFVFPRGEGNISFPLLSSRYTLWICSWPSPMSCYSCSCWWMSQNKKVLSKKKSNNSIYRKFPGSPAVRTLRSHCQGLRINPWLVELRPPKPPGKAPKK